MRAAPQGELAHVKAAVAELRELLSAEPPPAVAVPLKRSRELRAERAQLRERYAAELEQGKPERATATRLNQLEGEIEAARQDILSARLKWLPIMKLRCQPIMAPGNAAIEKAIELLDEAAVLHSVLDDFIESQSAGLLNYGRTRRGRRLADCAGQLRRILKSIEGSES